MALNCQSYRKTLTKILVPVARTCYLVCLVCISVYGDGGGGRQSNNAEWLFTNIVCSVSQRTERSGEKGQRK